MPYALTICFVSCQLSRRFREVEERRSNPDAKQASSDVPFNGEEHRLSKNQTRKKVVKKDRHFRTQASEEQREKARRRKQESDERAERQEPAHIRAQYGDIALVQSAERKIEQRVSIQNVSTSRVGEEIIFRGRLQALRKMSVKFAFLVFRQQLTTLQGVIHEREGSMTTHMVKWIERIPMESIVVVRGKIQKPEQPVKGSTIHDVKIFIEKLHVVVRRPEAVPFTVYEDDVSKAGELSEDPSQQGTSHISDRTRLAHRILDLRTRTSTSIFRINSGVCNLFRTYLDSQGFIEIHTPKLQAGATESGSSVFQLDYFGRPAFLAQSPQLAKQMAIAADFERVYEIGPVFRAENSNTHRHLTEYTGLDLEMAIEEHYHEALELIDETLKFIFKGIYERFGPELQTIKQHFPHEDLVWLEDTPKIPFAQGVQMLKESGWVDENGQPPSPLENLHTRDEIRLGQLMKEEYSTDYYIPDKFPASARPFYTIPDPQDSKFTNCFDIFCRGQEILTGGQRIHDAQLLEKQMHAQGVDSKSMEDYMEGFHSAAPPHAGAGIGLERILMLILSLGNIRLASLFPRDPKSISAPPPESNLRHVKDSTVNPPWGESDPDEKEQLQPLENLIWRDPETGAAVLYVPTGDYALLPGDPLCDISQYTRTATAFLKWLKREKKLKPIWVLVGHDMEEVLGGKMGWKTLTCAAEERIDADKNEAEKDHAVTRKVRHAEKEGVKLIDVEEGTPVPDDIKAQCDEMIQEWLAGRQGQQIYLSEITPWRDQAHRRYFYAQDKDGKTCALVVLAQLALRHGYQVKYSLDFADAPSGTIEYITLHAIHAAKASGTKILTFGAAATSHLTAAHNLSGIKVKMLRHSHQQNREAIQAHAKGRFQAKAWW
ncbi:hypothetical protein OEA41_000975 [Lepraria neglecta]|uniref:Aspartate--tRNA ligase, cytoplasmic n=1 Tax=Lepraria neglecta TaxID=209136 RepID=A0AAD9ZIZ2_9LECA|nr:hypothetical protein OEA41_000975 [Lepraria neglecta]